MTFKFSKEQLFDLYAEEKSIAGVARILDCSPKVIRTAMKRFDLQYEKVSRKYAINHHFFSPDQESEAQFYWAGFLAANANITRVGGYRIEMNAGFRDAPHLKQMLRAFGSDAPVKEVWATIRDNPYKQARVVISSKYMIQDLERFNVVPKKKHIYEMPSWLVKHKLIRHFLRGWVDGIGNFYTINGVKEFRTRGTEQFLTQFKDILARNIRLDNPDVSILSVGKNIKMLRYCIHKDVIKIGHYLYDNASHLMLRKMDAAFLSIANGDNLEFGYEEENT